jgi:hypothetical protein
MFVSTLRLHRSLFLPRAFFYSSMSQPQTISDPSASEPNPNSKSAGSYANCSTRYSPHLYPAKKEAKRLGKEAKLAAKAAKVVAATPAGEKKVKEKATKEDVIPFVDTTPKGQKKGAFYACIRPCIGVPSMLPAARAIVHGTCLRIETTNSRVHRALS